MCGTGRASAGSCHVHVHDLSTHLERIPHAANTQATVQALNTLGHDEENKVNMPTKGPDQAASGAGDLDSAVKGFRTLFTSHGCR